EGNDTTAHGQHVGIVVLAGQAGGVEVVAEGRPHTLHLVGRDLLALAAAPQHYAPLRPPSDHHGPHGEADRGAVDRFLAVGPQVLHLVAQVLQGDDEALLEPVAGVVEPYGDPYAPAVRGSDGGQVQGQGGGATIGRFYRAVRRSRR